MSGGLVGFVLFFFFEAERCIQLGGGGEAVNSAFVIDESVKPVLWLNYPVKHSKILFH